MLYIVQSLSHVKLFVTPWTVSMLGFPVLHCLPEFGQIHVHWVGDAIQPSHHLLRLSPLAFNLSQHQGFFPTYASLNPQSKYEVDRAIIPIL